MTSIKCGPVGVGLDELDFGITHPWVMWMGSVRYDSNYQLPE